MKNIIATTIILFTSLSGSLMAKDPIPSPEKIRITNGSILGNNEDANYYTIRWNYNNLNLVDYYVIYSEDKVSPNGWKEEGKQPINTKKEFPLNSFNGEQISQYTVEAVAKDQANYDDSKTNMTNSYTAQNIVLGTAYNACNNELTFTWNSNPLVTPRSQVIRYTIDGVYDEKKYFSVTNTENKYILATNKLTLKKGVQYKFQLEILYKDVEDYTYSNIISFTIPETAKTFPDYINIDKLDASSGKVVLNINIDPKNELTDLWVFRSLSTEQTKSDIIKIKLGSAEYPSLNNVSITDDSELELKTSQYKYTVSLLSCENVVKSSSIFTLPLEDPQEREGSLDLWWKPIQPSTQLDHYEITRYRNNGSSTLETPANTAINQRDYLNKIKDKQPGEFICYTITAYMNVNFGTSVSNKVCYQIDEMVTMPKYIVIGENNKAISDFTFPSSSYTPEKFTMRIYDRLGTKLFETTDPQKGWNGCYNNGNGSPVPAGAYIYSIDFTGNDGKIKHQQNSFIVVHK